MQDSMGGDEVTVRSALSSGKPLQKIVFFTELCAPFTIRSGSQFRGSAGGSFIVANGGNGWQRGSSFVSVGRRSAASSFTNDNFQSPKLPFVEQDFEGGGANYSREATELHIYTGSDSSITENGVVFMRASGTELTTENWDEHIFCSVVRKGQGIRLIQDALTNVHLPAFTPSMSSIEQGEQVEHTATETKPVLADFEAIEAGLTKTSFSQPNGGTFELGSALECFVKALASTYDGKRQACELEGLAKDFLFHSTYQLEKANETHAVTKHYEQKVLQWCHQVERVLLDTNRMRTTAGKDDRGPFGPAAELQYWENRNVLFCAVCAQFSKEGVAAVDRFAIEILPESLIRRWKEVRHRARLRAAEAADNVKYLRTFTKLCGCLEEQEPSQIIEAIPKIMSAAALLYNTAQFYNTSDHATNLLVSISMQMIDRCKEYIDTKLMWTTDPSTLLKRLTVCLELNRVYKSSYREVKSELSQSNASNQFDFSERVKKKAFFPYLFCCCQKTTCLK